MQNQIFLLVLNVVLLGYNLVHFRSWLKLAKRVKLLNDDSHKTNEETKQMLEAIASQTPRGMS